MNGMTREDVWQVAGVATSVEEAVVGMDFVGGDRES